MQKSSSVSLEAHNDSTYMPLESKYVDHELEDSFWKIKFTRIRPAKLGYIALLLILLVTNIVTIVYFSSQDHKQESIPRGYGEGQPRTETLVHALDGNHKRLTGGT
jgi:hypothetical protein